ncbi:MAG: tRNA (adenosine(37)-N6)-threonylcarbamoyltransferase complex transferase subunit TsaD [Magnetococcales bacterium]|nr:tRNA (adenosine(37)-N6)-threonylcarbamoyltransferase complex transferase subunit TsaD [Magnetococcales bacterium]
MRVLGIESSCDETAAAVVEGQKVLSNTVLAQIDIHAEYGGVVPELASRAHIQNIMPVIDQALREADTTPQQLDAIAVTTGPGLIGGLLVGVSVAKGLAMGLGCPLIGVHHMEGHLMSPFLVDQGAGHDYPFVALLVSGGHTQLLHVKAFGNYVLLGQTRDDAVGEAFDKGARLMGLGYPGGPAISAQAEGGDRAKFRFPRVLLDRDKFDFSFSGLKTSVRSFVLKNEDVVADPQGCKDLAASYQEALVETLVIKSLSACEKTGSQRLVVAGGVGANARLREMLSKRAKRWGVEVFFPPLNMCTDNGAMIAYAGACRLARGEVSDPVELNARARWPIPELVAAG